MERVKSGYLCYGIVVVAANVSLMKFLTFTQAPISRRVCYYTFAVTLGKIIGGGGYIRW